MCWHPEQKDGGLNGELNDLMKYRKKPPKLTEIKTVDEQKLVW